MSYIHITVRSLTYGQKGVALLNKNGIFSTLVRTTKKLSENGCGYSIKIRDKDGKKAIELLNTNSVFYSGVWREHNGEFERVSL